MSAIEVTEVLEEIGTGRRSLLGKAAIAAAVAAVTGVSMSKSASASVGNNVAMFQGIANTAVTATTSLAGGSTFRVINGISAGPAALGTLVPGTIVGSILGSQSGTSRAGIMGEATGTGYGWAVYGLNSSSQGIGVYGLNVGLDGIGLYGEHRAGTTEAGTGVVGISNSGVGVSGSGGMYDFQADGSGRVLLNKAGTTSPPAAVSTIGTLARDATGNLWYCATSGTTPAPGTWRKLAGPTSAGSFHAVTPGRLYDSRSMTPAVPLPAGQNRVVTLRDKVNATTIAIETANYVPAGATAIACNVTVANTVGGGFLAINPLGDVTVHAATINWSAAGQILNNGVIITLGGDRQVTVVAGGSGGAQTDFIIDVTGYFL